MEAELVDHEGVELVVPGHDQVALGERRYAGAVGSGCARQRIGGVGWVCQYPTGMAPSVAPAFAVSWPTWTGWGSSSDVDTY